MTDAAVTDAAVTDAAATEAWDRALADASAQLDALAAALDRGDTRAAASAVGIPTAPTAAPGAEHRQQLTALLQRNQELEQRLLAECARLADAILASASDAVEPARFVDRTC